ncbi:RtcB family protein, partial [candidate division WOR-3 bacterium]|nr:RtcB family protein [candidate division WOR-3 bacterium]
MKQVEKYKWMIEKEGRMRVPGLIYASPKLINAIKNDNSIEQVRNVAYLPGIQKYSLAMPDIHWGYGFPIGGVAAMDMEEGVISPGGVGYDVNCGVRVLRTNLTSEDIKVRLKELTDKIYSRVPCGVGSTSNVKISESDLKQVLKDGPLWAVRKGFGWDEDLEYTEDRGSLEGANPDILSNRAIERGKPQLGTLGSGNHFLEIQKIVEVYDEKAAGVLGLEKDQVTVMIHTGSRGLGHQVCSDWVNNLRKVENKYNFNLPDKELICAPIKSRDGQGYLGAMRAAANFAWANRQIIMSRIRDVFSEVFGKSAESLDMHLIYDVAHNIAKIETHDVNGSKKVLCVHRKGATRAFPPNHPSIPAKYASLGQPVLIPGDMGTA